MLFALSSAKSMDQCGVLFLLISATPLSVAQSNDKMAFSRNFKRKRQWRLAPHPSNGMLKKKGDIVYGRSKNEEYR
jgi:hypothetical protein